MADSQLGIALRPTKFDEVIGQEDTCRVLQAEIDKGEIPRAIMFIGPAGTGKTTLAKIIARAAQGWDFPIDLEPDLLEINAADMSGIDDMRELIEATESFPMQGKYRVIILDEAHQLSKPAQNCLLKPFERKDSATLWIICTTETGKIIPALRTRCQIFNLTRLSKKGIHELLVRAGEYTGKADFTDFEAVAIRENLNQPRPLLNAFGNYVNGMPAADAVNGQLQTFGFLPFEIAKAVVYGDWEKDTTVWQKPCKAVKSQFADLESEFKKKKKDAAAEDADESDTTEGAEKDEALGRPEVSRAIRAIAASLIKNEILKGNVKAVAAMHLFAGAISPNPFDAALEYPATVGLLFRVNATMTGKNYK